MIDKEKYAVYPMNVMSVTRQLDRIELSQLADIIGIRANLKLKKETDLKSLRYRAIVIIIHFGALRVFARVISRDSKYSELKLLPILKLYMCKNIK